MRMCDSFLMTSHLAMRFSAISAPSNLRVMAFTYQQKKKKKQRTQKQNGTERQHGVRAGCQIPGLCDTQERRRAAGCLLCVTFPNPPFPTTLSCSKCDRSMNSGFGGTSGGAKQVLLLQPPIPTEERSRQSRRSDSAHAVT